MGVDYLVFLGPYIEVPEGKTPTKEITAMYPGCAKCNLARKGSFCVDCGTPITTLCTKEQQEVDLEWIIEEFDIKDQVSVDYEEDGPVLIPIYKDMFFVSRDLKREQGSEDLSDINIEDEIAKVEKHCEKALKVLEKFYGEAPVVRWGLRASVG